MISHRYKKLQVQEVQAILCIDLPHFVGFISDQSFKVRGILIHIPLMTVAFFPKVHLRRKLATIKNIDHCQKLSGVI